MTIPPAPVAAAAPVKTTAATDKPAAKTGATARTSDARTQPKDTQPYQVRPGDNWQKLAREYMGSAAKWTELFEMNKKARRAPSDLRPGESIYVPVAKSSPRGSGQDPRYRHDE